MMNWQSFLETQIQQRQRAEVLRQRECIDGVNGRSLRYQGRNYLNFSSNDYLGMSRHPAVIRAWQQGADEYGVGSGGSGHITGYTKAHQQLEEQLAQWLGYSNALLFISGFAANHAIITALMGKDDTILADKLSHASILDASIHSNAYLRRFAHNSLPSLQKLLERKSAGKTLIVTEGVFSMDGDSAPVSQLHSMAKQHGAWLMVDDAHGIGVRGHEGKGSIDVYDTKPEILIVTFGKAFGLSGAAVLCDEVTATFLVQAARHLIYSTSMPPAQAVALTEAVKQIQCADAEREQLAQHIQYFRANMNLPDLHLVASDTAIQPIIVGDNHKSLQITQFLRTKNIWVQAIRPPTVPVNSARLRVTLSAAHQRADIDCLLEALNDFDDER